MAASMPWTTDAGTSSANRPARVRPSAICTHPAMATNAAVRWTPRAASPAPSVSTEPSTMTMSPAAGPLMVSGALPRSDGTSPPTMAVSTPAKGGKPLASAIARHNGSATSATTKPATKSLARSRGGRGAEGGIGGGDRNEYPSKTCHARHLSKLRRSKTRSGNLDAAECQ